MIFRTFLAVIGFAGVAYAAESHHDHQHQVMSGEPHVFESEALRIANVPVIDPDYAAEGFVSRFAGAGTLILSFTYTNCETLCPVTNAILAGVDEELGEDDITIVSLSIDPVVDTPEALGAYASDLGASDRWVWLTAKPSDNRLLLGDLGVDVATLEQHDPTFLIGDVCTGTFTRVIGVPEPDALIDLARTHEPCGA